MRDRTAQRALQGIQRMIEDMEIIPKILKKWLASIPITGFPFLHSSFNSALLTGFLIAGQSSSTAGLVLALYCTPWPTACRFSHFDPCGA